MLKYARAATVATAAGASLYGVIDLPQPTIKPAHVAKLSERFARFQASRRRLRLADTKPEWQIMSPSRIAPAWLPAFQDTLYASMAQGKATEAQDTGRWLKPNVVAQATTFLHFAADLLPGTPYISGTADGELIAEFSYDRGNLTAIVTREYLILYAVVDDKPTEKRVSFASDNLGAVRSYLSTINEALQAGPNAAVDA